MTPKSFYHLPTPNKRADFDKKYNRFLASSPLLLLITVARSVGNKQVRFCQRKRPSDTEAGYFTTPLRDRCHIEKAPTRYLPA